MSEKSKLSRRNFLKTGIGLAGFYSFNRLFSQTLSEMPHFFLQILIGNGADAHYMFDSRPHSFTAASQIANYSQQPPVKWQGQSGGSTWASPHFAKLSNLQKYFSIINGVHTSKGFDGHEQNINAALTANPFGGNYFAPLAKRKDAIIDFLALHEEVFSAANLRNISNSLIASADQTPALAEKARSLSSSNAESAPAWRRWITQRTQACAQGQGMFAAGCQTYSHGLAESVYIASRLAQTSIAFTQNMSQIEKGTVAAMEYFRNGITNIGLVATNDYFFDTHDAESAKRATSDFDKLADHIGAAINLLRSTPFNQSLSMLDVTTVMISSEFSRTNRQLGKPITATGTDHNPYGNTVILAGKGIRGGNIIGATDLDEIRDNEFTNVSEQHRTKDPHCLMKIGKAFDFKSQQTLQQDPNPSDMDRHLTFASVQNTVLEVMGVPRNYWLKNTSDIESEPAKTISSLIA